MGLKDDTFLIDKKPAFMLAIYFKTTAIPFSIRSMKCFLISLFIKLGIKSEWTLQIHFLYKLLKQILIRSRVNRSVKKYIPECCTCIIRVCTPSICTLILLVSFFNVDYYTWHTGGLRGYGLESLRATEKTISVRPNRN